MAKSKSKNNLQLVLVFLIIVGVATAVYLTQSSTSFITDAFKPGQSYRSISSSKELDVYLSDLDKTDVDLLDSGIQENNTDAASF